MALKLIEPSEDVPVGRTGGEVITNDFDGFRALGVPVMDPSLVVSTDGRPTNTKKTMSSVLTPDEGSNAAGGVLDELLGTAGSAVDVWQKWQNGKVAALQAKAAIPSTVTSGPLGQIGGFKINAQTVAIAIGAVVALFAVVLLIRKR